MSDTSTRAVSPNDDYVMLRLTRTDAQHVAHTLEMGHGGKGWSKHSAEIAKVVRAALQRPQRGEGE